MYRILTEDIRRGRVIDIISRYTDGATIYPATGLWRGKLENSLAIELSGIKHKNVLRIAEDIKRENDQKKVLIQRINTRDRLV